MKNFAFVAFSFLISSNAQSLEISEETIESLERLTHAIMQEQEKKLNVSFDGEMPIITLRMGMQHMSRASYDHNKQEIVLNAYMYQGCSFDYLRDNLLETKFTDNKCNYKHLRRSISHELGHYYVHLQLIKKKNRSWLDPYYFENRPVLLADFGAGMVIEGVGEFFGDAFGDRTEAKVAESAWSRYSREEFEEEVAVVWFTYMGGHAIVSPILDSLGVAHGVRWILSNSLEITVPDFRPALLYRERGEKYASTLLRASL